MKGRDEFIFSPNILARSEPKQTRPRFDLVSPIPFPTMIIVTLSMPPLNKVEGTMSRKCCGKSSYLIYSICDLYSNSMKRLSCSPILRNSQERFRYLNDITSQLQLNSFTPILSSFAQRKCNARIHRSEDVYLKQID